MGHPVCNGVTNRKKRTAILRLWTFMIPPKKLVVNIKNKKIRKEIKIPHHAEGDGDIRTVEGFGIDVAICCVKRYNINRKKTSAE